MLDRASTFADPEIVKLLKTAFVPVAIDQAYQRRQQDAEGEFYRKIAGQSPRNDFRATTQGFYIATAAGELLLYNNNRDPAKVRRLMKQKLAAFQASAAVQTKVPAVVETKPDPRYQAKPPKGGLVVRVHAKVLGGYASTSDRWRMIIQNALSRDNLWISANEHQALTRGELPKSLLARIARFHLVDNTRGEPPMWRASEIRTLDLNLQRGQLGGVVELSTEKGDRGFNADIRGVVTVKAGKVMRFDLVAHGQFWGEGQFTRRAPKGRFPLGISFTLADGSDIADTIPPQGSRGWVKGYLR